MAFASTPFPPPFLPCPGEPPIPFDTWEKMFRNYLLVLAASGDAWPEERKRALLLHTLGTEGQRLFYTLPEQGDTMEDAITALKAHFNPRRSQKQLLSELQKEKFTVRDLQNELNTFKLLYEDLKLKYHQDILVFQQLKNIKDETFTGEPQDIKQLRIEHESMCKTLIQANRNLHTSMEQTKIQMQAELDQVKDSLVLHRLNSGWDQASLTSQLKVYDQLLRAETEAHCQTQTNHFLELNSLNAENSLGRNRSPKRKRTMDESQNELTEQSDKNHFGSTKRKILRRE